MIARLRLRRGVDFRAVYSARRVRHGRLLALHSRPNQLGHPRVGFSISKKVGGAVLRNRLKRGLREVARPLLSGSAVGFDLVVVVRPAAVSASRAELEAEFRALAAQVLGL